MNKGDKVIAMGYRSQLTRAKTMGQLTAYYGGFYGYEAFTGYPVFDDPKRVSRDMTPWVFDTLKTREEATAMMKKPKGKGGKKC